MAFSSGGWYECLTSVEPKRDSAGMGIVSACHMQLEGTWAAGPAVIASESRAHSRGVRRILSTVAIVSNAPVERTFLTSKCTLI